MAGWRPTARCFGLAVVLLGLFGCGPDGPDGSTGAAGGSDAAAGDVVKGPPLAVAILPYTTPSAIAERFTPLADYLERGLGQPVDLHFSRDYAEPLRLLADGKVDMAYLGPSEVVRLERRYPERDDLRLVAVESPYRAAVVVREGESWEGIADLRGRTFAFGSHRSLASHFVARNLMADAGISLADLADYEFLQRQERIVLSVLHGDYDAGALSEGVARQFMGRNDGLRLLTRSDPLPAPAFAAGPAMSADIEARVRELLVGPRKRLESLEEVSIPRYLPDFHAPDHTAYERVEELMRRVEQPCPESCGG